MSDEQRDTSWDADPATPEQMQLVERVCNRLGFEGYYDTTCGWWRNEWNRPVFVPVVSSIALAYEFGRLDDRRTGQATQQAAEPMHMALCESESVVLREGQPYVFRKVGDCERCAAMSAESLEAYGPASQPSERADGVLQGEWVITGPDGSTFRGATPLRAALHANRHRVQTDPVEAKRFHDAIEQGRREAEEENARLIAEHGTLNCPACGGSGHVGDAAASPAAWATAQASAPVAYEFVCKRAPSGGSMAYASIDEDDSQHWPMDQWRSVLRTPLAPCGPAIELKNTRPAPAAPEAKEPLTGGLITDSHVDGEGSEL